MCSKVAAHLYGTLVRFKNEVSRRASSGSFAGRAAGTACVPARLDHFSSKKPSSPHMHSGTQVRLTWDVSWQACSGSWQGALRELRVCLHVLSASLFENLCYKSTMLCWK